MSKIDERTEVLINRRLDGELTQEEGLELDQVLLNNHDAQALLEDYQRVDDVAGQVLQHAFAGTSGVPQQAVRTANRQRSIHRAWWALPFVAAAALVIVVLFSDSHRSGPQIVGTDDNLITMPTMTPEQPSRLLDGRGGIRQAASISEAVDRTTNTNALYIIGNDGQLYVIEQQRLRTARVPNSGIRRVSGDL